MIEERDIERITEQLKEELLPQLRAELISLHLGDDAILSEESASQIIGVSVRTLRRLRAAKEIPYGSIGNKIFYSVGQIRRFSRERVSRDDR